MSGKRLASSDLFGLIAFSAQQCMEHSDWEPRMQQIERCLAVLRARIGDFAAWHAADPGVLACLQEFNDCGEVKEWTSR